MSSMRRILFFVALFFGSAIATADSGANPDLRQIMQGLRDDSILILDGLLLNDLDKVANSAASIADHPAIPPDQVAVVAAELGSEMAAFKRFDSLVHDLSLSIRSAALEGNRESATTDYRNMINGCLACHVAYRERVSKALGTTPATDQQ